MRDDLHRTVGPRVAGIVLLLLGLALAAGGAWLVALAGSWYYACAGLAIAVAGALLLARRAAGLWLFALVLAASAAWAVAEAGFEGWRLLPRLDVWLALGVLLLLPWVQRGLRDRARGAAAALGIAVVLAGGALAAGFVLGGDDVDAPIAAPAANLPPARAAPADWTAYGGSGRGDRYSAAAQITPANVGSLALAWTFHTGDFKGPGDPTEIANEATPLAANGRLYFCTPHNIVIALDPDSGRELWRFDPRINRNASSYQHMICRGVAYWDAASYPAAAAAAPTQDTAGAPPATAGDAAASGTEAQPPASEAEHAAAVAACPRRIYAPTADATIVAINADDGRPCAAFGTNGVIDLKVGEGQVTPGFLNPTSPPTVTARVLVAAASVTDNDSTDEPSGVVRGYDIDTGRLLWNFDASRPDATAPLPPGQTYVRNSPNMWSVASVDEALGLVYLPMGNQTPDIWGGNRDPQGERFNSAIVALDIASGRLRWVYQTVHHDLWDMDIGGQPSLVDLDLAGARVPALIASTKRGDLYVLDRRDGRLLVPAPEQPVPQGAAQGDHTASTQPFSALSYKPAPLRDRDMWGTTPYDQLVCRILFRQLRYDGIFTPPSEQGSLVYPGNYGVFDWGGIAIDPVRQILFANPSYMAFVSKLHRRGDVAAAGGNGMEVGLQPMTGTPFAVDLHPLLSPLGVPCQAPPWGYVAAVDLRTLRKAWMHRNGTTRDSSPVPVPFPLGVPALGGPMVTAGGVAFMAATLDDYLRAYDTRTGRKLWEARLPAGGQATPMSYVSARSGRQYVVIMAGGHGSLGTKMGDSLLAYALPAARADATAH
jgi:quinoprotein glucose dehydrogenase